MNARLDINRDGQATVTRDGKRFTVSVRLEVQGEDRDLALYDAADSLAALAEILMTVDTTSGPVLDDDGQRVGEWEIYEAEHECSEP